MKCKKILAASWFLFRPSKLNQLFAGLAWALLFSAANNPGLDGFGTLRGLLRNSSGLIVQQQKNKKESYNKCRLN
jgi:hypothetical protein